MCGKMWRGWWGNQYDLMEIIMRMIKDIFIQLIDKALGNEDLIHIDTDGKFFVTGFDSETQTFRKILFNHEKGKFEFEDMTDPEQVAKKVVENVL